MKRTIYIAISALMLSIPFTGLKAQHKHEFSTYAAGGLSTLKYKTTAGTQKNGTGSTLGLGYTYFVSPKIGLNTGIEFSFYNSTMKYDDLSDKHTTNDINDNSFEYRTRVTGYKEQQRTSYLNIPLMVQFQTGGDKHQYYIAGGAKVGFVLNGTYKDKEGTMNNSGYYPEEDYEYTSQQFLGFGTFASKDKSESLDIKTSFLVSTETGIKWRLKEDLFLYTGVYFDYGLNNILDYNQSMPLVSYNKLNPSQPRINSIFSSHYLSNGESINFTQKVTPMAVGIKIKIAFRIRKKYMTEIYKNNSYNL